MNPKHLTFNTVAFFAAAKKVSAAPHRGNANRPIRKQGKTKRPKTKQTTNPARHRPEPMGNAQKIQINNKNRQPGKKYQ